MNRIQLATGQIKTALDQLQFAQSNLRHVKNDQHVRLAALIAELKEINVILMDPECTPEIQEAKEAKTGMKNKGNERDLLRQQVHGILSDPECTPEFRKWLDKGR